MFGLWVADEQLHAASLLADGRYAAVREAVDVGVLVVEGADYTFRHALMCEAVLSQLLPMERRKLHERAARALAGDPGTTSHRGRGERALGGRREAGRGGRVVPACARKARRLNAYAESWGHYQRALRFGRHGAGDVGRLDLVLEAAGTARPGRRPGRGRDSWRRRCGPTGSRARSGPRRWNGWAASSGRPG